MDDRKRLRDIIDALREVSRNMVIYFPMHPRTKKNVEKFRLNHLLENTNVEVMQPMPYLKFLALWKNASLVLTDSGGLQEETTALGVPCFTIREIPNDL